MNLAVVGKILDIHPIPGADFIQQAIVVCGPSGRWSGVVSKDIAVGQLVIVFLQDAVLPPNPAWAFMERHKWRVRMTRFKGVASECVILPLTIDPCYPTATELPQIGDDMTLALGVTKYSKPLPPALMGEALGLFPSFIPKTDEPNFQAAPELVEMMDSEPHFARLKYDGTSCTAWNDDDGVLHVASRNLELKEFSDSGAGNVYWRTARLYDLSKLPSGCALQFEVIGPGVQKNPLGLEQVEGRAFRLYDFHNHRRCSDAELVAAAANVGMPEAQLLFTLDAGCFLTPDDLRELAQVKYPNGQPGEGLVVTSLHSQASFKIINLLYRD